MPTDALALPDLEVPAGHRLVSLATRPDLEDPMSDFNVAVWAGFMLEDRIINEHWGTAVATSPGTQLLLLDGSDAIAATANTTPLAWDGTDDGLPAGMDGQFLAAVAGKLGLVSDHVFAAYEDAFYYLWRERRLPSNVDPFDSKLEDPQERARLARVFEQGLDRVVGHVLPITRDPSDTRWRTGCR